MVEPKVSCKPGAHLVGFVSSAEEEPPTRIRLAICVFPSGGVMLLWMDEIVLHPRNPGMIWRKYQQTMVFCMVSKWCKISSIHSRCNREPLSARPCSGLEADLGLVAGFVWVLKNDTGEPHNQSRVPPWMLGCSAGCMVG